MRSPTRQHSRPPSSPRREIKETLDARLTMLGADKYRVNQYEVNEEVGRGSFGAVYRVIDTITNQEYAMKEISKSRLRRQNNSQLLRARAPGGNGIRGLGGVKGSANKNPIDFIRPEIAILKKLHHVNVADLVEVLDDPEGDSIYMVLEWCAHGVLMKVSLDEPAVPYSEEQCRLYFRDLILGIEYLHSQGVVHRDIKPDNLLLDEDDVLKIVDFGVSEMFERDREEGDMVIRHAGSPAFIAPEQCAIPRVEYSGRAADIWSMGVTLYCLITGKLPFTGESQVEIYSSIELGDYSPLPVGCSPSLQRLLKLLLEHDFRRRITMKELRNDDWVTAAGEDELLSYEENVSDGVSKVTGPDLAAAIRGVAS
ncbi:kinase-like domain-containing protein [Lipomyces oligophaga]|uniref:kinase-like domain-containing protein n=1 Tax=Lipomyces oligophaga TaxID=45792 RepID=UPI0034CF641F